MNLVSRPVALRRLADRLERRGRADDRALARRARVRGTELELGDKPDHGLTPGEVAQLLNPDVGN